MFSTFVGELKGYFGKAFVLAVWLPVFMFASAGLTVYLTGQGSLNDAWQHWLSLSVGGQGVLAVEFLIAITVVAFSIHYMQLPISRFFEGYWDGWPLLNSFGQWKRRRYSRALQALDAQLDTLAEVNGQQPTPSQIAQLNALSEQRLRCFPQPGDEVHLMPTRLGNIYKAAELYPYRRYAVDSVVIWPRLRSILPKDFVERLQETKIAIDFLLLVSLLSLLFSLISLPYLIAQHADIRLILVCALGLLLALVAYRSALVAGLAYGELIKVAFDMHRRPLLASLGLPMPATLAEERQLWQDLANFLFRGIDPATELHFAPSKPTAP